MALKMFGLAGRPWVIPNATAQTSEETGFLSDGLIVAVWTDLISFQMTDSIIDKLEWSVVGNLQVECAGIAKRQI